MKISADTQFKVSVYYSRIYLKFGAYYIREDITRGILIDSYFTSGLVRENWATFVLFNTNYFDVKFNFAIFVLLITTDMKKFGYLTVKDSYRCVVTLFLSF